MTPCPYCDQAAVVDETGCCVHCGADRTREPMTRAEKVDSLAMILAALDDRADPRGWRTPRYQVLSRLVVEQLTADAGGVVVINADPRAGARLRRQAAGRARWRRWWS